MTIDDTLLKMLSDEDVQQFGTPSHTLSNFQVAVYNCFRQFAMECVAEWEGGTTTQKLIFAEVYTIGDFMDKMHTDYEEAFHECMALHDFHNLSWSDVLTIVLRI